MRCAVLPPALQSAWLVIHVFVASLGTGFFALGFALSAVQLLQFRRESLLARSYVSLTCEVPVFAGISNFLGVVFLAT